MTEISASLLERFEAVPALANADAWLMRRGRFLSTDCLVGIGTVPYRLAIEHGRIARCERGPFVMPSWTFAIRGEAEAWEGHWEPMPAPHYHDIFALSKRGLLRIEGDLHPLMANVFYFKTLLALPRRQAGRG
jgi:hypothetical protein